MLISGHHISKGRKQRIIKCSHIHLIPRPNITRYLEADQSRLYGCRGPACYPPLLPPRFYITRWLIRFKPPRFPPSEHTRDDVSFGLDSLAHRGLCYSRRVVYHSVIIDSLYAVALHFLSVCSVKRQNVGGDGI